jgi:small ligand-binding sensory domain FIST
MSTREPITGLRFAAALSTNVRTDQAIAEVCGQAGEQLGGPADLALLFVSHQHGPDFGAIAASIAERLDARHLLGCTGEAIVGGASEVEGQPALALWLARLPGVTVRSMHLRYEETVEGASFVGWPDDLPDDWPTGSALITLGDPFSFAADAFLDRINEDHPGVPIVGGMASGGWGPGQNRLVWQRGEVDGGAVAALIHGPIRVRTVVSQGCRPIGKHLVVTKSNGNVIQELGGRPPLEHLQEIFKILSPRDQQLIQQGLHVGRVINEYQERFERGDFLIRNVIGADPGSGAIAITDVVRPGQTVQFHVRDARSADDDLHAMLGDASTRPGTPPLGALVFTCNGRGARLFGKPHHDAAAVRQHLGEIPAAGFFAQGELGPVGGQNFIHGFTASIAIFEEAQRG